MPASSNGAILRHARNVGRVLFIVGITNFIAFFIVAIIIGGDAFNGEAHDGRYYVRNHAIMTEVSHGTWLYSRIHVLSQIVTFPLGLLGLLVYAGETEELRRLSGKAA